MCIGNVTAKIISVTEGGMATARFTNPTTSSFDVGFASYQAKSAVFELPQVLFDHHDQSLPPGITDITIAVPNCYYQLDAYCGKVIENLIPDNLYGPRLVADAINAGSQTCSIFTR